MKRAFKVALMVAIAIATGVGAAWAWTTHQVGDEVVIRGTMTGEGIFREYPPLIVMSEAVQEQVTRRWAEYGFTEVSQRGRS